LATRYHSRIDGGSSPHTFTAGTLAGAGCFRCEECGFAIALHELDEVPGCPHCGGSSFKRGSIFGDKALAEPVAMPAADLPDWLAEVRAALIRAGDYLAYEDGRVRVVALQDGWTRLGRSLSAQIRFDDPTVSRRHALIHREEGAARILDDRSLNGVFLNGDRVDWHAIADGDRITIGRFDLHFMGLTGQTVADRSTSLGRTSVR
jgi:predicted  nucleic acid-binding Zn-ribbon protein